MLEWAIRCYRSGMARKAWLEAEVATSSPAATAAWVRRTVRAPATVAQVLTQFLRLICIHRRWQYAEVWYPVMRDGVATPGGGGCPTAAAAAAAAAASATLGASLPGSSSPLTSSSDSPVRPPQPPSSLATTAGAAPQARLPPHAGVGAPPPALLRYGQSSVAEVDMAAPDGHCPTPPEVVSRLAAFRDASRSLTWAPGEGLPGRVAASLRPVWVGGPPPPLAPPSYPPLPHGPPGGGRGDGDGGGGDGWEGRSAQAAAAGLTAAMGVPVLAGGRVVAVATFFATTPRAYDTDAVAAVHGIAGVLGNELTDAGLQP